MGPTDTEERHSMMDSSSTDDDSFEFRILMAYAKRTFPDLGAISIGKGKQDKAPAEGSNVSTAHNVGSSEQAKVELRQTDKTEPAGKEKSHARKSKGKKKPIWKRIPCLRGESEKSNTLEGMDEDGFFKSSHKVAGPEAECEQEPFVNEVAEMLQKIINSRQKATSEMMIRSYSLEVDATEDEQRALDQIIALLTTQGDSIEEIKKDSNFTRLLSEKPSLPIFKQVMDSVLEVALPTKMNSDESETERKLKIAVVVHATTRFVAVSNHPMAQIMGFGAKYLQENCTTWVTQKGGWAKLLEEEHID